ncbi:MAG: LL-diaminopimelate aminotransferase [Chlamydiales bacterium]|nr:LL-diaminopimelate aminotransferase [Chlamydiales bacterium]
MPKINPHFFSIKREYIFPVIERKLAELKERHPGVQVLNMGVGDVSLPLAPSITHAICEALQEMSRPESIRGYGPGEGYLSLRKAIVDHEYAHLGITPDEIFISDGINSDIVNILDLFKVTRGVGICDPTYPVYLDASVIAGLGKKVVMLPCTEKNKFAPQLPDKPCDLIFLCSPSNPTGVALTRKELKRWVDYAKREKAIILYDNAYVAFITSPDVPKSIYEIEGAKEVAIEFRSFSKTAGFTGLRCAYTVLPKSVCGLKGKKEGSLHPLWMKRQNTKFNGVAYPIQKGAEAVYSEIGQKETRQQISSYLAQAKLLSEGLRKLGYTCYGGADSPYIWWKTPNGAGSWDFFNVLLEKCHLVSIPGRGFGPSGEGYIRLSAFTTKERATEALKRIAKL